MPLQLTTLGTPTLAGPNGAIALDEARLVALIVMLAIAGEGGVSEDDLLLRLAPESTPAVARAEIARLVAVAQLKLGGESSIRRIDLAPARKGYAFAPGVLSLDVRILDRDTAVECAEFLAGSSVPGSPEFGEWLAATRRRVVPIPATVHPRTTRRRWVAGATLGIAVATITLIALRAREAVPSGFSPGDPLLLADIQNETGDTIFDRSLASAAAIGLQQSVRLRLYPRSRLPGVYRLMRIANIDTTLTFDLSKQVAQRDDVRFVVGVSIARDGEKYLVSARLADVGNPGGLVEVRAKAKDKNAVLPALDDVLAGVRRSLGESRADVRERREPLPHVTTSSLEALRSYADGSHAWMVGDFRLAGDFWRRAVDLDTGFATAYSALAQAYVYGHEREPAERYLAAAFRHRDRLSEWELLHLEQIAAEAHGRQDSSVIYTGQIAARFPSVVSWYNYGTSLMNQAQYEKATAALQTALKFDPRHINSWINLATIAGREDRSEDALRYYGAAARIDSMVLYHNNLNSEWGATFVRLNRYAEAESAFRRMASSETISDRALGLRSLGALAFWQGRLEDAAESFRRSADAAEQSHAALSAMRSRIMAAAVLRAMGRDRDAEVEIRHASTVVSSVNIEPQALVLLATAYVKIGRIDDARTIQTTIRQRSRAGNPVDASAEAYTVAMIALATNHADSALSAIRGAGLMANRSQQFLVEAEAFRALGQLDSARVAIDSLRRGHAFASESEEDLLHAPLVMGDILLAQGDTTGAMRQYQALLDQWRAAPPSAADVVAARTRMASLRGTPDRAQARQAGIARQRP